MNMVMRLNSKIHVDPDRLTERTQYCYIGRVIDGWKMSGIITWWDRVTDETMERFMMSVSTTRDWLPLRQNHCSWPTQYILVIQCKPNLFAAEIAFGGNPLLWKSGDIQGHILEILANMSHQWSTLMSDSLHIESTETDTFVRKTTYSNGKYPLRVLE
jgi:hypothetical protein